MGFNLAFKGLIHHLRFLGSQQHPQNKVILTWGTENSLVEINLESTGVMKKCNNFWGSKIGKNLQLLGGRIIVQQERISRAECSWTNPLNALQEVIY
jgi:hypothetical protein